MKRCPECDFLYNDSDTRCDLDGNLLVSVEDDGTVLVNQRDASFSGEGWRWLSIVAVVGIAIGVIMFMVYHRANRKDQRSNSSPPVNLIISQPSPDVTLPSPPESPSPTPEIASSQLKPSPTKATPKLSANPVSTSVAEESKHGVIIRLADGGTLVADEAWRTKEGIWYRRNGVVTLLKSRQVKVIEKAP
jgi:hypothetical protein